MENSKFIQGLTFDDILLIPQKSNVLPAETNLQTMLTRTIKLNLPILSSAMDTVTESQMAIALARAGGIGFIHKNMSIEKQANEVDIVKRSESGMITKPITISSDYSIKEANEIMKQYKISGLPIVDENTKLLGLITNRDIKYVEDFNQKVTNLMTPLEKLITVKTTITLKEAKLILHKHKIEKLPLVDSKGVLKGLITSKDIDKAILYPSASKDSKGRLLAGAAVGASDDILDRVKALVEAQVDVVVLDSAHGHSNNIIEAIKNIKKHYPKLQIIAGNIVTKEAAKDLIAAGADGLKIGIGPGSICTTRIIAGVGVPQLTAIRDVYEYSNIKKIPIIADGGIRNSGDITKAIAFGADSVMLGSIFAGCEESPGEEIILEGRKFKIYAGMGSLAAMARGSKDRYFQKSDKLNKLVPEGIESRVPYKGKASDVIYQLSGGLRSGMGYCGMKNIQELQTKSKFVQITSAGLIESHPHDIIITKEAPNYSKE